VKKTNDFKGTSDKMLQRLVRQGQLDQDSFRIGQTKVLFWLLQG
jgi:hypothetical protein